MPSPPFTVPIMYALGGRLPLATHVVQVSFPRPPGNCMRTNFNLSQTPVPLLHRTIEMHQLIQLISPFRGLHKTGIYIKKNFNLSQAPRVPLLHSRGVQDHRGQFGWGWNSCANESKTELNKSENTQISFSGFGRLARWRPMCAGLSGLPALFQLYILWTWKPNEVSSTSTMSIQHGVEGRCSLMKILDGWETRIFLNCRFTCWLLSSCEDITTDCDDCHAGVPHCQVGNR